jgi:hypothetical protein
MPNATLIEVEGDPVGLAVRDGRGFRFHATAQRLRAIDGKLFATPAAAARAARELPVSLAHPSRRHR